jgi:galactonate dehydratase
VFDYRDGFVNIPQGPGLGIDIDEDYVRQRAAIGHDWHNPLWHNPLRRNADGSVAEW